MNDPECARVRDSLGVYVVGAIGPSDRAIADAHLPRCQRCREELAGLAGLPALLRRVPVAQAERIAGAGPARSLEAPPAEPLLALLAKMAARRKRARFRTVLAVAAALLLATGGGAAAAVALVPAPAPVTLEVAQATSGPYTGAVRYYAGGGTDLWVRIAGVPPGTSCRFWVLTRDGRRVFAGGWTAFGGSDEIWYQLRSPVQQKRLAAFLITARGQGGDNVLVRVPVT